MLQNIKKVTAVSVLAVSSLCAAAQDNQSGYFVDDFTYRFLMNPAIDNSKNFVAIPAVGNIGFGLRGNLNVKDVLYNVDGRTTTFLNPKVSAAEVMGNLSDVNRLGTDLRVNLLAGGFKAFGGYNTVNISARTSFDARLPRSVFSLLKEGVANKTYDISDLSVNGMAFGEISFGHSRNITEEIRVGGNLKFLIGIASVTADLDHSKLDLQSDSWNVTTNARVHASIKGLNYKMETGKHTGLEYVSGLDGSFSAPNGFGMALDLGAVYSPKALKDWQFSLSFLDLGFISWSNDLYATTNGDRTFRTDAYTFNPDETADNSFSKEWKRMRNALEELYQLETDGNIGSRTQGLHATMNIGAQYTLPVYRRAKFGLLNTTRIAGKYSWTDFRVSGNVSPCDIVSLGINGSFGTFGCGFGWIANLHCTGFNLFIAQDHVLGKLAKQGVPLSSNASTSFGLNVLF